MMLGPSNTTGKIDSAFLFIVSACVILLAIVTICMVVFLIRYNRARHPRPEHVRESILLEVVWTVIPTILVIFMFYFGWVDFEFIRNPPRGAMPVEVTARQWSWLFTYDNGKQDDVLRVPVEKPVKLIMTSVDVLHCLFIPAFRIKEDCVPGMKTHLWFTADRIGSYDIYCTEYCGVGHSHMRSKVIVMAPADFEKWRSTAESKALVDLGPKLLQSKGCLGCHSLDGSPKVGPTFKGLYGRKETVETGGRERSITADEAYIDQSIREPQGDIVKGYPPVMPRIPLTDDERKAIVAYLETVK
jgi:cytochrome c oxidase subunit II